MNAIIQMVTTHNGPKKTSIHTTHTNPAIILNSSKTCSSTQWTPSTSCRRRPLMPWDRDIFAQVEPAKSNNKNIKFVWAPFRDCRCAHAFWPVDKMRPTPMPSKCVRRKTGTNNFRKLNKKGVCLYEFNISGLFNTDVLMWHFVHGILIVVHLFPRNEFKAADWSSHHCFANLQFSWTLIYLCFG